MGRRAFLSVLAIVSLLATGLGLWVAAPALAAPKPIGLSADGVTFGDQLPASLFASVVIVPGGAVTRSFWVKNRQTSPGNLAIALQGVAGADHAMVAALSLNSVAGAASGPVVAFSDVGPCRPLVSAIALAPGAITRIDVTLALSSSLPARASQGSLGSFDLRVTLASTDVAAPNGCTAVVPPVGDDGDGSTPPTPPGEVDTTVVSGAADGGIRDEGGLPELSGSGDGAAAAIVQPNSTRSSPEFSVVGWLVVLILGGIFAWWRRSRDPEVDYA